MSTLSTTEIQAPGPHPVKYSPDVRKKALSLAESGSKPLQISKELNVNLTTVYYWLETEANSLTLDKSLDLASRFENSATLFLGLAVKKARKAPFNHLMTGAGIAIDKARTLRGEDGTTLSDSDIDRLGASLLSSMIEAAERRRLDAAKALPPSTGTGTSQSDISTPTVEILPPKLR